MTRRQELNIIIPEVKKSIVTTASDIGQCYNSNTPILIEKLRKQLDDLEKYYEEFSTPDTPKMGV